MNMKHIKLYEEHLNESAQDCVGKFYKQGDEIEIVVGLFHKTNPPKLNVIIYDEKSDSITSVGVSMESGINFFGHGEEITADQALRAKILAAVLTEEKDQPSLFDDQDEIADDAKQLLK
jgi:hypothetical protein